MIQSQQGWDIFSLGVSYDGSYQPYKSNSDLMAEAQLVASVVHQELLEELVPPRCESCDELDIYGNIVTGNGEDTCHSYYRLFWDRQQIGQQIEWEEIRLWLTVNPWLRANYNDAMRENRSLLTCQRTLPIAFNRFNRALSWLKKLINQTNRKRLFPNRTR